jgi:hypothetical protein
MSESGLTVQVGWALTPTPLPPPLGSKYLTKWLGILLLSKIMLESLISSTGFAVPVHLHTRGDADGDYWHGNEKRFVLTDRQRKRKHL